MNRLIPLLLLVLPALPGCNTTSSSAIRPTPAPSHESVTRNIDLGVEYMRLGSYEKALEKLERAKEIDPDYFGTYNVLGRLYQLMGENKEAERNFRRALSLDGNDSSTLNNYGQFLCQNDRAREAEQIFKRAFDNPLNESPEIALTNAGLCLQRSGDRDKAEGYFRRALEISPTQPEALIRMAQVSYDNGKYLSARGYYQRYTEVARPSARSLWLGIQIERELGDKDAVASYILLLRNNFPDSEEAGRLAD